MAVLAPAPSPSLISLGGQEATFLGVPNRTLTHRTGKSRYKSLTSSQCEVIERDFQLYSRYSNTTYNNTHKMLDFDTALLKGEVHREVDAGPEGGQRRQAEDRR